MSAGLPRSATALAVALLVFAACGDPTESGDAAEDTTTSARAWNDLSGLDGTAAPETTEVRSPTGSIISDDDSARIVWSFGPADGVEFIGVHDGTVYVSTDTQIIAASLVDGSVSWRHSAEDYLSDGLSVIGMDGDAIWVIAPYNADLTLDAATGKTIRQGPPLADLPAGFVALDAPAPTKWTVESAADGVRATDADGAVAWQLQVADHVYAEGGPAIEVDGLTIVPADDGFVYAIATG